MLKTSMANRSNTPHPSGTWYANLQNHLIRILVTIILIVVALMIYHDFLSHIIKGRYIFGILLLYLIIAYAILPRTYRVLSRIFIPNYFIGRTQVGDRLLGDPINLAFNGTGEQLTVAMGKAGWHQAEALNFKSSAKMTYAAILKKNYPNAPVSSLFLFNKKQDFAFEKDLDGNPRKRHHIRFWKTPDNWWLPGGYKTDWLAAATFDEHVGLSLFTGQITHKIDGNVDQERNHVVETLKDVHVIKKNDVIKHFTTSYHSRNGGGDSIHTDGALPFVTLN
jgi:hypothetical protein